MDDHLRCPARFGRRAGRARMFVCVAAVLGAGVFHAAALVSPPPETAPLPQFDTRGSEGAAQARAQWVRSLNAGVDRAAAAELVERRLGAGGRMTWLAPDVPVLRTWAQTGDAVGPGPLPRLELGADPQAALRAWLAETAPLWGWGPGIAAALHLARDWGSPLSGVRHLALGQTLSGLPVVQGELRLHLTADGTVAAVYNGLYPAIMPLAKRPPAEPDAAADAVHAALALIGLKGAGAELTGGAGQWLHPALLAPVAPEPVWFPLGAGARPAWRMRLEEALSGWGNAYEVIVAADGSGAALRRRCLTLYAQAPRGRVYTASPAAVDREVTDWIADPTASPLGWLGLGERRTVGNNCAAGVDGQGANVHDLVPEADATLLFDPAYGNLWETTGGELADDGAAAAVNLFYWGNLVHDWLYSHGFDERAGNFQDKNFGRGGAAADAVQMDAQDGYLAGYRNNANFTPTPDGFVSRAQFFLFTDPYRDSAFDPDVVVHELIHGLSTRLTGTPIDFFCLEGVQGGAMGEGWSDFLAGSLLNDGVMGEWVTGQADRGIRRYPYSPDMSVNPLTYADLCAGGCEVHDDGEIWAAVLWDVRAAMIELYGQELGVALAEQVVIEGMAMTPCAPSMLDGRDAILAADQVLNGGAHRCLIWRAFARRGMGDRAQSVADGADVQPAFEAPCDCTTYDEPRFWVETVRIDDGAAGNGNGMIEPAEVFALELQLANGGAAAPSVGVRARSLDSRLTLLDDVAFWPQLECGDAAYPVAGQIELASAAELQPGTRLPLELEIYWGGATLPVIVPLELTVCPGQYELVRGLAVDWQDMQFGIGYSRWDDLAVEVPLGFDFTYQGSSYSNVFVSINGLLAFGAHPGPATVPQKLPDPGAPNNVIAPFWTDLTTEPSGIVITKVLGDAGRRRFAVEWRDAPHYPNIGAVTFQAVLFEATGEILFQYRDVDFGDARFDAGASAAVGIEDRLGKNGVLAHYLEPALLPNTAMLLRPAACAAFIGSRAVLRWTRSRTACAGTIALSLRDIDRAAESVVPVRIEAGPPAPGAPARVLGMISMQQVSPGTGVFTAEVRLGPGTGWSVEHGEELRAVYDDAVEGEAQPRIVRAIASVDCVPPALLEAEMTLVEPERAVMRWRTDEAADVAVLLAASGCPASPAAYREFRGERTGGHLGEVTLAGLVPGTIYYYKVRLTDTAGNARIHDNGGLCYEFAAPERRVAGFPFVEGFEAETLASYWETYSTYDGVVRITRQLAPYEGRYHLVMEDRVPDFRRSLNELTLTIDLTGRTDVMLRFFHRSFSDEADPLPEFFDYHRDGDGVSISIDGSRWYRLLSLTPECGTQASYREFRVLLDPVLKAKGLRFSNRTRIRFQQTDNTAIDQDGFAFDLIQVVSGDHEPPAFAGLQAAEPEENAVRLSWFPALDPSHPIRYRGYMTESGNGQLSDEPAFETEGTVYRVKDLNAAHAYSFIVHAVDGEGNEDLNLVQLDARPLDSTPPAFAGIRNLLPEPGAVRLSWAPGFDLSTPIRYHILRGPPGGGVPAELVAETTNTVATITGIADGAQHCYLVRAFDAVGNPDSNAAVVCGAPAPGAVPRYPFADDFEAGTLGPGWQLFGSGRARVTGEQGAWEGSGALVLDDPVADGEQEPVAAVLVIDLAGATNVVVRFHFRSLGDEPHPLPARFSDFAAGDGVAISPDGIEWVRILDLAAAAQGVWRPAAIALDPIMEELGWNYTERFRIGFFQVDNAPAPQDGLMFDAIAVGEQDSVRPEFAGLAVALPLETGALLGWLPARDESPVTYWVFRGPIGGTINYSFPAAVTSELSIILKDLNASVEHLVAVRAVDAAGNSDTNTVVRAVRPFDSQPPPFAGLNRLRALDRGAELFWLPAIDPSSPVVYRVHMALAGAPGGGDRPVLETLDTRAQITGLRNGRTYCFRVDVRDAVGNLAVTQNVLCVTPVADPERVVFARAGAAPEGADGTADRPFPSLAQALAAVPLGGEVRLAAGHYSGPLLLDRPLAIEGGWDSAFGIQDAALYPVTLAGHDGGERFLDVPAIGVSLRGLTLALDPEAGLRVSGSLTLERVLVTGLAEAAAPAIEVSGGQLRLHACRLEGGAPTAAPVLTVTDGYLALDSVLISAVHARQPGADLVLLSDRAKGVLRRLTAAANRAPGGAVAAAAGNSELELLGAIISGNIGGSLRVATSATARVAYSFLDSWEGAPEFETHLEPGADPGFRDPALGDFHLSAGAAAVDLVPEAAAGADPVTIDVDGLPRPFGGGWDAGAFELRDSDGDGIPDDLDPDRDGDGMENVWEVRNGMLPLVDDALLDPDRDRMSNLDEHLAGTDPWDSGSALAIEHFQWLVPSRLFLIGWSAVPGRAYLIERAAAPAGPWSALSPPLAAPAGYDQLVHVVEMADEADAAAYYRVRLASD